jgi:hypothetical protein
MDAAKLNDWMQVAGIFALVASLIFVGLQMKQAHEIAISQAFQARSESTAEILLAMASNEQFVSAMTKQRLGEPEKITEQEKTSFGLAMNGGMYLWENSFYQFKQGFLSEEHWSRTRYQMKRMLAFPMQMAVATENLPLMRPEFREELSRIIDEVRAESGK